MEGPIVTVLSILFAITYTARWAYTRRLARK